MENTITDEFKVVMPDGFERGWSVGPRSDGDQGFDWMAYGPEDGKLEFEFGACSCDETPERAIAEASAAYDARFRPA